MNEKKKQGIPIPFKLDDFFTTQEQRDEDKLGKIENIDINLIDDFKDHPFKVLENDELKSLEESIKTSGVLSPVIIRPKENGRYEMISGHRRKLACQKLGYDSMPAVVKELSNEMATIFMVDSNLQREKLLPSEKAFAYKMKYDAMKHQGKASDPMGPKLTTEEIGDEHGDSSTQVKRYIRLTNLIPELLEMVDNAELGLTPAIALRPAVELSFLDPDDQYDLLECIEENQATPSLAQAIKLKELSQNDEFDVDVLEEIMGQQKPNQVAKFKIHEDKLMEVLPRNIERNNIEDFIIKACSFYSKHLRQKDMER